MTAAALVGRSIAAMSRALVTDFALSALLLAIGIPITMSSDPDLGAGTWLDTALLPTLVVPILLRRRFPLAAAALLPAACVVSAIPTFDQFRIAVAVPAGLLVTYTLGRDVERHRAIAGLLLVLCGMAVIGSTDVVQRDEGGVVSMIAFSFPLLIVVFGAARLVRSRERLAAVLAEQSVQLERRREETAALAVELERTRLASDLDMATRWRVREIVDLAREGEHALAADPEEARSAFGRIERMGRESLNELRELLGVLRSDERANRSPRPTLAELEALLADARRGGRLVDLEVEGDRRPLPSGVELAAYRAVQHALVAIRGGDGAPASIVLRYLPAHLELEVRGLPIDGLGADVALVAARERVCAHGGSVSAEGSREDRRVLTARIPLIAAHA